MFQWARLESPGSAFHSQPGPPRISASNTVASHAFFFIFAIIGVIGNILFKRSVKIMDLKKVYQSDNTMNCTSFISYQNCNGVYKLSE